VVVITYPAAGHGPLGESLITVEGRAEDEGAIKTLWVNGVRATATSPNYATWQAQVPLSQGWTEADPSAANVLVVSALDARGNYDPKAARETVLSVGGAGLVRRVTLDTRYRGSLVPGDVDSFQFEATAGTRLWLGVRQYGRSQVDFALEAYDPAGKFLDIPAEVTEEASSLTVSDWPLPTTGLYTVRLLHRGGDGMYVLRLRGEVPATVETVVGELGAAVEATHALTALRGSVLTLQVKTGGWAPEVVLRDPCGRAMPLTASAGTSSGLLVVREVQLPDTGEPYETGTYEVVVTSTAGVPSPYRLTRSLRPPVPEVLDLEEALLLGAEPVGPQSAGATGELPSPTGGSLLLRVAGADALLTNNVVRLDGQPVTIAKGTLHSGRGTLVVTLPASTPAGTSAVYFLCGGEKSNEVTFPVAP
jgi:hypothetical protein